MFDAPTARPPAIEALIGALHGSRLCVFVTDAAGLVDYANAALCAGSGYAANEWIGAPAARIVLGAQSPASHGEIEQAIARGQAWRGEVLHRQHSGRDCRAWVEISPVALPQGAIAGFLGLMQRLQVAEPAPGDAVPAVLDRLTGLPCEPAFRRALQDGIERARPAQRPLGIARIEIDRFKSLGESIGRGGVDNVVVEMARRLHASIRQEDMLARLGDDAFGLMLADHLAEPVPIERILAALAEPTDVDGHPLVAGVHIGTASFPANGDSVDDLMLGVDAAVAQARRQGRSGGSPIAVSSGAGHALGRSEMLAGLRRAIERDQLVLHYQPQLNLHSGEIVGVEALMRWAHPERGLIPPQQFIALAEESGLIVAITEWALERACNQAVAWRAAGLPLLRMGVNLSARHFRYLDLHETVGAALRRSGLDPRYLELELTESVMMHDSLAAMRTVAALKELGVRLSLDDFGTGWSSLAYLSRFAIDALKIDRSFIHDVTTNEVNASIVSATIAMAHKLGKGVIAEGVETVGQMHFLHGQDCDEMQGFLFAPALPATELAQRVARGDRLDVHRTADRAAGGNRLLLVDDEANILTSLRRLLRREGYEIFSAASGAEGLELLAREKIHVIVCDQRMPGMSGTEFLSYVKSMYPQTVRIVLSGYSDITAITGSINQGAIYKYFSKPWHDDDLKSDLRAAFRHWRAQWGQAPAEPSA